MNYNLIQLFKRLKELKPHRKDFKIKPSIRFKVDTHGWCIVLLPTIVWEPWIFRYPNGCVVEIWWLNFCIGIGKWVRIEKEQEEIIG